MSRSHRISLGAMGAGAVGLVVAGLLAQHSAALGQRWATAPGAFVPVVVALGVLALAAVTPVAWLVKRAPIVFGIAVLVTCLPLLGQGTRGVHRWLSIGPLSAQPAELLKVALVLALAWTLGRATDERGPRQLAALAAIVAAALVPALLSPDLGTALVLALIAGTVAAHETFTPGARAMAAGAMVLGIPTFLRFGLRRYQESRLLAFLVPDPLGASYQSDHAVRLVATGSSWGRGLGSWAGAEAYPLSQASSDFVLAVWAHETGFAGLAAVVACLAVVVGAMLRIAGSARSPDARRVALGLAALLFWQAVINVAMVLGLLPVVGVPLPFVSRGGTSLVVCAIALGLAWSVAREQGPATDG